MGWVRSSGSKIKQTSSSPWLSAVGLEARHLSYLSLSFSICKLEVMKVPSLEGRREIQIKQPKNRALSGVRHKINTEQYSLSGTHFYVRLLNTAWKIERKAELKTFNSFTTQSRKTTVNPWDDIFAVFSQCTL